MVQEPQSFHEFMPDKVWKWKILEEKIEKVLSLHNFQEIRLSVLQDSKVLQDGITALVQGQEADSAMKGVLSLSLPDEQLSLLSLRPEGTISVLHHTARITIRKKFIVFTIRVLCSAELTSSSKWNFTSWGWSF